MHVKSVPNVVSKCNMFVYADDMCLIYAAKETAEVQKYIQKDFESICKWAHDNGIILNTEITKCMHKYSPNNQRAERVETQNLDIIGRAYGCLHYRRCNCSWPKIQYVDTFKYLGLIIDSHFNWKTRVNCICSALRSVLCKFYHLQPVLNKHTLRVVYLALADSILWKRYK